MQIPIGGKNCEQRNDQPDAGIVSFFIAAFRKKYTPMPAAAISVPHSANHPVEMKRKSQMAIDSITGNGY
ncbi:MAG TPA: hypothetical protein VGC95_00780, partial [Chitinophagaceae bacterium]